MNYALGIFNGNKFKGSMAASLVLILLTLTACGGNNDQDALPTLVSLPAIVTPTGGVIPSVEASDTAPSSLAETVASETRQSPLDALAGTARQTTLLPPGGLPATTATATGAVAFTAAPSPILPATLTWTPVIPTTLPTLMPLPVATIIEVTSVSSDDAFYIAVSGRPVEYTALPAPSGQHWLIVVATLANNSGSSQTVASNQLRLVDTAGNRYLPEPPDSSTAPPLIEITLKPGESVRGEVRYALPLADQVAALEWCLDSACTQTIQSLIP